jgi:hypothetical protein
MAGLPGGSLGDAVKSAAERAAGGKIWYDGVRRKVLFIAEKYSLDVFMNS